MALGERAQCPAGADLDQQHLGALQECGEVVSKLDTLPQVPRPIGRIGRLRRRDPVSRDVGQEWDPRRRQGEARNQRGERGHERLDRGRVECAGRMQESVADARGLEGALQFRDGRG